MVTTAEYEAAAERINRAEILGDPIDPADKQIVLDWIAPVRNAQPKGRRGTRTWSA